MDGGDARAPAPAAPRPPSLSLGVLWGAPAMMDVWTMLVGFCGLCRGLWKVARDGGLVVRWWVGGVARQPTQLHSQNTHSVYCGVRRDGVRSTTTTTTKLKLNTTYHTPHKHNNTITTRTPHA